MTHIPRPHPPIWARLCAGFLVVAAILIMTAVSLIHDPPKVPSDCLDDRANPWCAK